MTRVLTEVFVDDKIRCRSAKSKTVIIIISTQPV